MCRRLDALPEMPGVACWWLTSSRRGSIAIGRSPPWPGVRMTYARPSWTLPSGGDWRPMASSCW